VVHIAEVVVELDNLSALNLGLEVVVQLAALRVGRTSKMGVPALKFMTLARLAL